MIISLLTWHLQGQSSAKWVVPIDFMKFNEDFWKRFWSKVEKTSECWFWNGSLHNKGYGNIKYKQKQYLSHRISYEKYKEKIPFGLQIDHLCRVRNCVNPEHLEAVTSRENTLRGENHVAKLSQRTHCNYGHPFSGENLYFRFEHGKINRSCRTCSRNNARKYRIKNRPFRRSVGSRRGASAGS